MANFRVTGVFNFHPSAPSADGLFSRKLPDNRPMKVKDGDLVQIDHSSDLYLISRGLEVGGKQGSLLFNIATGNVWRREPFKVPCRVAELNFYLNSNGTTQVVVSDVVPKIEPIQFFHVENRITFGYKRFANRLQYTFAICSLKDQFSRKRGREQVTINFQLGHRVFTVNEGFDTPHEERSAILQSLRHYHINELREIVKSEKLFDEVRHAIALHLLMNHLSN